MTHSELVEKVARAIAPHFTDDYDNAFKTKSEWNRASGQKAGRHRDINEPFQSDFDAAAREAIRIVGEACDEAVTFAVHKNVMSGKSKTSPHECAVSIRDLCQCWKDGKSNERDKNANPEGNKT